MNSPQGDKKRELVEKGIARFMDQAEALEAEGNLEEAEKMWKKAEEWMKKLEDT